MLALHVVRGGEDLAERRTAQHRRVPRGVVEAEGEVRLAFADAGEPKRRDRGRAGARRATASTQRPVDPALRCFRAHRIVQPPSTVITWPVQYEDASEARKRRTPSSSSILPGRPMRALTLEPAPRALVLEELGRHLAREPAGGDRIDPHAVRRPLRGELAREPVDCALRGDVAGVRDRGGGDEPNMELTLMTEPEPCARIGAATACDSAKSASRFTRRTARKPLERRLPLRAARGDAGVVHADVDPAEPLESASSTSSRGPSSTVTSQRAAGGSTGARRGERVEPLEPACRGDDLCARRGEHGREAGAEAARGSGHDGDPAGKRLSLV